MIVQVQRSNRIPGRTFTKGQLHLEEPGGIQRILSQFQVEFQLQYIPASRADHQVQLGTGPGQHLDQPDRIDGATCSGNCNNQGTVHLTPT